MIIIDTINLFDYNEKFTFTNLKEQSSLRRASLERRSDERKEGLEDACRRKKRENRQVNAGSFGSGIRVLASHGTKGIPVVCITLRVRQHPVVA